MRDAAERWPADRGAPARLLVRLILAGHEAARARPEDDLAGRRRDVEETAGALAGVFPKDYLAEFRDDWPACASSMRALLIAHHDLFHDAAGSMTPLVP